MGRISLRGGAHSSHDAALDVSRYQSALNLGSGVGLHESVNNCHAFDVSNHHRAITPSSPDLSNVQTLTNLATTSVQSALLSNSSRVPSIRNPRHTAHSQSALLRTGKTQYQATPDYLKFTTRTVQSAHTLLRNGANIQGIGVLLRQIRLIKYQHALRPLNLVVEAKRFEPTGFNPCALPPPSYQLPFDLLNQGGRVGLSPPHSPHYAFDLLCRENKKPKANPTNPKPINPSVPISPSPTPLPTSGAGVFGTYTAASSETKRFELLSLSITTDIESFCWQASFEVSEWDYRALDLDSYRAGEEPVLSLMVNGLRFDVLAEDWSDTRRFVANRYQITGRSITARLSRDYAKVRFHHETEPRSARQIAESALEHTPYQIERWEMVDWLIPEHQIHEQTPIETIAEIAQAAGAFVYSHRFEPKLSTKALYGAENDAGVWRVKAPQVTISDHLILSISGKRQTGEQYRGVYVVSTSKYGRGAHVYRENSDGLPEATSLNHPYFTDDAPMRAAGIKVLSDSGTHKIETVTLPLIDGVPLAELGQTWAFTERGKTWQGIIKAITLDCTLDNDALFLTQALEVDRYLGD